MLRQIAEHDTTEFKQTIQTERHTLEKQLLQDVSTLLITIPPFVTILSYSIFYIK